MKDRLGKEEGTGNLGEDLNFGSLKKKKRKKKEIWGIGWFYCGLVNRITALLYELYRVELKKAKSGTIKPANAVRFVPKKKTVRYFAAPRGSIEGDMYWLWCLREIWNCFNGTEPPYSFKWANYRPIVQNLKKPSFWTILERRCWYKPYKHTGIIFGLSIWCITRARKVGILQKLDFIKKKK